MGVAYLLGSVAETVCQLGRKCRLPYAAFPGQHKDLVLDLGQALGDGGDVWVLRGALGLPGGAGRLVWAACAGRRLACVLALHPRAVGRRWGG
eukprot:scaffold31087_cov35-Prasinocladus_malaysianus.AAC.1